MPYCRSHVAYPRPGPRAAGGPRGTEREPGVRGASRPQFEPHATRSPPESELSWPLVSELKQPVYTILNQSWAPTPTNNEVKCALTRRTQKNVAPCNR